MIKFKTAWCLSVVLEAVVVGVPSDRALAGGDRALGEYLSSECVTCHQITGQYQGIPPIVGWPDTSFIEIIDEYRQKKRNNPIMQTIAGRFSNEEIAALAAYFGSLKEKSRVEKSKSQKQQGRK